uniref:uncharacterized protein LOC122579890 n=1 Tax=Erigeron canadensis TaxID=72917 RepID=UPI001CB9B7CF|nr:uncharacterized protein LOC122579890 [Erigeron canadensis]
MAAKSDFAQKLLHDLRLRKERMGVAQGSGHTNATARDAYRNPGNVQRGSRHTKSLEIIGGAKTMNQNSNRALSINESSQQLVSYTGGQHQRAESIGDLSMAFTYAVKNGEKIMNMDFSNSRSTNTMIEFLQQIGRRSLDVENTRNGTMTSLVKHRPSSGGVVAATPALTTIQIKEISKGVQNLYEIIRSGSSGTNMNRYSMEVGKELLKGAKGLEESLRMLVSLQEASEMMVTPQRKSRVTLLEVDDENDQNDRSKVVDRNQVALPRFSFDKPSRKTNMALPDASSEVSGHQRSASAESVRSVSTTQNASNRSGKGRISNVIAKLMGLEEVSVKVERDYCKIIEDSSKSVVNKTMRQEKESIVPLDDRKSQNTHELDTNNKRFDQLPKKPERQMKGETKEKLQHKRRGPEDEESLRVDKKKTIRKEKKNEIRLVPRSNNQAQKPEKRTQKGKQDSQVVKQVKNMSPVSKELQIRPIEQNPQAKELQTRLFEQNPKAKDPAPKTQVFDKTERYKQPPVVKEKPVIRKKENVLPVRNTDAPRLKDEVLKRRNRTGMKTLAAPTKHKLSVLKETKIKDVTIHLKPEETKSKMSNLNKPKSTIQVPDFDYEIKNGPQLSSSDIIVTGARRKNIEPAVHFSKIKLKKAFYSNTRVVLTEDEKQLKEILIEDQLFLSTAKALFRLDIPVGFLHVDDHNDHHRDETKLKRDCGYEILKRKARSQELSVHPYVKPSVSGTTIRFLDELVKQLYKDLESLRVYGRNYDHNEYDEADYLYMLERDIYNTNPDINSFWDFGWHITTFSFVEKDEFVNDVEGDVLHILVDEIVDDLMSMHVVSFLVKRK